MSHRRAPRTMQQALSALADQLAPDSLLGEVQRIWGAAVGSAIAEQARPASERAGVLTVVCSSSVWAQELDLMAPQIISSLNDGLRAGAVSRLRCVCTGA